MANGSVACICVCVCVCVCTEVLRSTAGGKLIRRWQQWRRWLSAVASSRGGRQVPLAIQISRWDNVCLYACMYMFKCTCIYVSMYSSHIEWHVSCFACGWQAINLYVRMCLLALIALPLLTLNNYAPYCLCLCWNLIVFPSTSLQFV